MSSEPIPIDAPDFLFYVSESLLVNYASIAGLSCYAYDCLLTLPLEVEAIWKSRPNATTILFLINRYAFMFNWVLFIVSRSIVTDINACTLLATFSAVANVLNVVSVSGIFILRTYAICGRNKWILGSLGLLFLSRFGLTIWSTIGLADQNGVLLAPGVDSVGNCVGLAPLKPEAIEVSLTVVFDAIVFILTISRTWVLYRRAKAVGISAGLSALLLRDGSIYFGILSAAATLEAIVSFDQNLPVFLDFAVQLTSPLEVILASRLVLNLRTYDQSLAHDLSKSNPATKTDVFFQQAYGGSHITGRFQSGIDSVLGNIGASLKVGYDLEDGEGDEHEVNRGKREHCAEDGVDPLSLGSDGTQSEREVVNEGQISLDFTGLNPDVGLIGIALSFIWSP